MILMFSCRNTRVARVEEGTQRAEDPLQRLRSPLGEEGEEEAAGERWRSF